MGYYIPNNERLEDRGANIIECPESLNLIPNDKALLCEVNNGFFLANALIFSKNEFDAFNYPKDKRSKRWFVMDKDKAHKLAGYK